MGSEMCIRDRGLVLQNLMHCRIPLAAWSATQGASCGSDGAWANGWGQWVRRTTTAEPNCRRRRSVITPAGASSHEGVVCICGGRPGSRLLWCASSYSVMCGIRLKFRLFFTKHSCPQKKMHCSFDAWIWPNPSLPLVRLEFDPCMFTSKQVERWILAPLYDLLYS